MEKEFSIEKKGRCVLNFDSLDPGGEVWLNGKCIAQTDSFEQFSVDITLDIEERSENHLLQIRVNPRAPEVLYEWHRHKDTYIGWFCEKVTLKIYDEVEFSNLQVITEKVGSTTDENSERVVEAVFKGTVNMPCTVKIFMAQFWNGQSDEREIRTLQVEKTFVVNAEFMAKAWSPETPALYAVHAIDTESFLGKK